MPCFAPHMVSVITPVKVSGGAPADRSPANVIVAKTNFIVVSFNQVLCCRLEPEAKVNVAADRMVAVVGLDRAGQRIGGEICADTGFHVAEQLDIACKSDCVGADPKGTADLRLPVK